MNARDTSKNKQPDHSSQPEPDIDREESVPTDGTDQEGEEMMKQVRNDQLKDPPPKP